MSFPGTKKRPQSMERHRFPPDGHHELAKPGFFKHEDHVDLIEGELILVPPPSSEPEPGLSIVEMRACCCRSAHPGPEDVLLLIKAAGTSAPYDKVDKARPDGMAGIPEQRVIEIGKREVRVFPKPTRSGCRTQQTRHPGGRAKCGTMPELALAVSVLPL